MANVINENILALLKGNKGDGLRIKKYYDSVEAMQADYSNSDIAVGDSVAIKETLALYVKGTAQFDYVGTLKGADGRDGVNGVNGTNGQDGADGATPEIGENGNWYINGEDTGKPSRGEDGTSAGGGASYKWIEKNITSISYPYINIEPTEAEIKKAIAVMIECGGRATIEDNTYTFSIIDTINIRGEYESITNGLRTIFLMDNSGMPQLAFIFEVGVNTVGRRIILGAIVTQDLKFASAVEIDSGSKVYLLLPEETSV